MRLKQLQAMLIPLLFCTLTAAAFGQKLTGVNVSTHGRETVVTLRTSDPFTHNEYRPEDNLLLVDLNGVSAADLANRKDTVESPAVKSYRVLTYKGTNGAEVTRLELHLGNGVSFRTDQSAHDLVLHLLAASEPSAAASAKPPASVPARPAYVVPVSAPPRPVAPPVKTAARSVSEQRPGQRHELSKVAVVRTRDGLAVELHGASEASTSKLSSPYRLVIDLPNTVVDTRSRDIFVNARDVHSVRVGQFRAEPPVARIVVDLKSPLAYDLVRTANGLIVQLRGPVAVAVWKGESPAPSAASPVASARPAAVVRNPVVAVNRPPAQPPVATGSASLPQPTPSPNAGAAVLEHDKSDAANYVPASVPAASQPAPPAQQAQPYAFVEPQYHKVQNTPAERAAAAAETVAHSDSSTSGILPPVSAAPQPMPAVNLALAQQEQAAAAANAPAQPKYTGEPISVNLKDVDLKDFFRLIHEISGLNIVLDPNVHGTVTIVLDDVPWDQALDIVLRNNGLASQLEGNVLRIASLEDLRREADARHAQEVAEAQAIKKVTVTRFLSYSHAKDIMPTVKRFLSPRGEVIADDRTNALIISDIPSVIPEVDKLISQLDRKTQEVEIEARVVAATRNFARDLGMQLGFGWGNGVSAVGGPAGTAGMVSPIQVNGLSPRYILDPSGKSIPLFSNLVSPNITSGLSFVNATNSYRIDAILTMAESRGLLKVLSRPRIVTQNNVTAIVKQGLRIPVVTQAQLGGPPTTTYVEADLRLTVTPQITVENTIFLSVDVENTTPDFGRTVGGNPTLITQQATTQVLVTDGGTVVIGGVIQTQNSISRSQVPLLGSIPILGNLFKQRSVSTSTQELIFFLSPRIIQT